MSFTAPTDRAWTVAERTAIGVAVADSGEGDSRMLVNARAADALIALRPDLSDEWIAQVIDQARDGGQ